MLRDAEQSQKLFLQRLFPDLKDIKAKSHKDWLEELASKVVKSRKDLMESKQNQAAQPSSEEVQKLEGQVKHYKSVLDETVSTFNSSWPIQSASFFKIFVNVFEFTVDIAQFLNFSYLE